MSDFWTLALGALALGGVYALIALGYTMVYGIAKMLNFAHGDIIMVGAYSAFVTFMMLGMPVWLCIIIAIIFCTLLGIGIEKAAYRPLRGSSPLAILITAIGVSYLMESIVYLAFSSAPKNVVLFPSLQGNPTATALITLGVATLLMVALVLFINYTKIGKAMRAVSEDRGAAQLMGINVNFVIMVTFAIGSALAAVAAVFWLMKTPLVTYTMGSLPGIKAFSAAVIGGIGSIPGAMIGGIIMGLIETFCDSIPGLQSYTMAIEFAILVIILLIRPSGLLGKTKREKV
ncbi:MAG: branched-chain amino acid ABC transporter permease [Bacilli bacterium]|nr:branched-chain amino acid ABC transporter permease [Bacilli bacterium]